MHTVYDRYDQKYFYNYSFVHPYIFQHKHKYCVSSVLELVEVVAAPGVEHTPAPGGCLQGVVQGAGQGLDAAIRATRLCNMDR